MPISLEEVVVGKAYSRHELAQIWGYACREAISRGVVTPRDDNKIVLFVTQNKRPQDEQYEDELVGTVLLWEGPNDHFAEARLLSHRENGDEIHLFFREQHRDDFTYIGEFGVYCCQQFSERPSRFVLRCLPQPQL